MRPACNSFVFILNLALALLLCSTAGSMAETGLDTAKLRYMVLQDCGSCHGMTMKGGLGPSLEKKNMQRYTRQQLEQIIAVGRPQQAMPAWNTLLQPAEIRWIAAQLLAGEFEPK